MKLAKYRDSLPQLGDRMMLTDGGLETTLIFHDGIDLPYFASFDCLKSAEGRKAIDSYYTRYAEIALAKDLGFILDSATWRASSDWGARLGYSPAALDKANRDAIELLYELRERYETPDSPFVISGNIGPRGDGYSPERLMNSAEAEAYHAPQVASFEAAGVDMITVMTMTHVGEATGIARAAAKVGIPVAMSFTVETDGRLPTGETLGEAIAALDSEGEAAPAYYMINCAHPDHFRDAIEQGADWTYRIRGVRANASRFSHAELDEAETLDAGDPKELGQNYADLQALLPNLRVFGGCCGTDHRHIDAMATSCCGHMIAA